MIIRKTFKLFRSTVQWVLLGLLILSALYTVLGRLLVVNIGKYEIEIETYLTDLLKVPVDLESASGSWKYLDPKLHIEKITIGIPGSPAIVITGLNVRLDSIRSLLRLEPTVREIVIDDLQLGLIRSEDLRWKVAGLPEADEPQDFEKLMNLFEYLSYLKLNELDIEVSTGNGHYRVDLDGSRYFEITGYRDGQYIHSLFGWNKQGDGETNTEIFLGGRYKGNPGDLDSFYADIYANIPELELKDFMAFELPGAYQLAELTLGGDFWIKSEDGLLRILGDMRAPQLVALSEDKLNKLSFSATQLFQLTHAEKNWHLAMRQSEITVNEVELEIPNIDLVWTNWLERPVVAGQITNLDVSTLMTSIDSIAQTMGAANVRVSAALEKMSLQGTLQDVGFFASFINPEAEVKLIGKLAEIGVKPYKGVPGITNLAGVISLGSRDGYLNIHSENLTLNFSNMFDLPWEFDYVSGKLGFSYESGSFELSSGLLDLTKGELQAKGKLQINLPQQKEAQTWGLVVGIKGGKMADAERFLPNTLSPELKSWLHKSLVSGSLYEAGLLFHGSLFREAPKVRKVYQLYFKADDSILNYDEKWPPAHGLKGVAYIHNLGVTAVISSGQMFDSQLTRGIVTVPMSFHTPAREVNLDLTLSGSLVDGIRFLNETPVGETLNNLAEDWSGEGSITTRGFISIPIGDKAGSGSLHTDVRVNLNDADLSMPKFDIHLSNISGPINYDEKKGLYTEKVAAVLFNQPVTANISSTTGKKNANLHIGIRGSVLTKDLFQWSGQPLLTMAAGKIKYNANLNVPFGKSNNKSPYLEVLSDLEGVEVWLPYPVKKDRDSKARLVYEQVFSHPEQFINIEFEDEIRIGLVTRKGKVVKGAAHIGSNEYLRIPSEGIQIKGRLHHANYEEWINAINFLDSKIESSLSGELSDRLEFIELKIDEFSGFGIELVDVDTFIQRDRESWNIRMKNQMLDGNFIVSDDESIPVRVNLDYLKFEGNRSAENSDPLSELDPTQFLNIDFSVNEISYGEESYGSWAFRFRPTLHGAELFDINADTRGLVVNAGSRLAWQYKDGVHESRFTGVVIAPKLESALKQWGIPSSVEGTDFKMRADVLWAGSPVMVSINKLKGFINLKGGKGRFVQIEKAGALKAFGIFDFASIARRLKFDFSDVVKKGYSYNKISGMAQIEEGEVTVVEPVEIEGSSSTFTLAGTVNLKTGALDNDMIVTLPVTRNLPWYAAIVTGPLVGVGTYLLQKILKKQINQFSSGKYKISGTVDEPVIEFVKIFDDSLRDAPKEKEQEDESEQSR